MKVELMKKTHRTMSKRNRLFSRRDLILSLGALFFCLVFLVLPTIRKANGIFQGANVAQASISFPESEILAESAIVYDLTAKKVLYDKNAEVSLPLASITKIMTAVTALEAVPSDTIITIEPEDLTVEGDSGLYASEKWRLDDLLGLILIQSSNDGAFAVSSAVGKIEGGVEEGDIGRDVFTDLMNRVAKKIGLSQSFFSNATGLDLSPGIAGAYGSAHDIALLMGYAVSKYSDVFSDTKYTSLKYKSESGFFHTAVNTNASINDIPLIMASKTGFTDLAGGNLAVVFDAGLNRPIVVVVLHSTEDGRFKDTKELVRLTLDYVSNERQ